MAFSRYSALAVSLALTAALASGCKKEHGPDPTAQTGSFSVKVENVVGSRTLALDTDTYTTAAGDAFTVGTFRYYLSNMTLLKADGSAYALPDTYFLVDASKPVSFDLAMPLVPAGDYSSLRFVVGVDSARTKAGNYTGVLTSDNGMFWDMNGPEFINLKLEGTSPQSPRGGLVFHIAGYKGPKNTIRTVTLPFPGGTKLLVRTDRSPEIHLKADVLGMFGSPNPVRFATTFNTTSAAPPAGALGAAKIADNIAAGMFEVEHIHAN